jgi:uncharacterized protein (TIGR02145 family)
MKKIILLVAVVFIFNDMLPQAMVVKKADGSYMEIAITTAVELSFYLPCVGTLTVSYESKTYNTVQIGNQCWLKENLDVGTRIDGNQEQTDNTTMEKYCYNNDPNNCAAYGGLYQWAETVQYENGATNSLPPSPVFSENVQGICPSGWHVPSYDEFVTLAYTVNSKSNPLKAIGQGSGSGAGSNISGFSALLAGYRASDGSFTALGQTGSFWSSGKNTYAHCVLLYYNNNTINITTPSKVIGSSVRCLKN